MKKKKLMQFVTVFAVLAAFSTVSFGMISPQAQIVRAVEAIGNEEDTYVRFVDGAFDSKVLNFLQVETVCALTTEQATEITKLYEYENRIFVVGEKDVNVLYLKGNPLNKQRISESVGSLAPEDCQVVHGNKIVALISPVLVS